MALGSFWIGYQALQTASNNPNLEEIIDDSATSPPQTDKPVGIDPTENQTSIDKDKEQKSTGDDTPQNPVNSDKKSETIETPEVVKNNPPIQTTPPNNNQNISGEQSPIGLTSGDLNRKWGQPDLKYLTSNDRVTVVAYDNPLPQIDKIKYSLNNSNEQITQVELVVANNSNLSQVISNLNTSMAVKVTSDVESAIAEVVQGQTDLRSFYIGKYKGMAQKRGERLEIRVWKP